MEGAFCALLSTQPIYYIMGAIFFFAFADYEIYNRWLGEHSVCIDLIIYSATDGLFEIDCICLAQRKLNLCSFWEKVSW